MSIKIYSVQDLGLTVDFSVTWQYAYKSEKLRKTSEVRFDRFA
jgi:hypothetical protein